MVGSAVYVNHREFVSVDDRLRTHRRWCPWRAPTWAEVCAAGAVRYVTVVSSNLTTAVVDGSVRVKYVLKVL